MSQFLLILKSDRSKFDHMSGDDQSAQIARYNAWVEGLVEINVFKNGLGLQAGHYEIRPDNDFTVDGPFTGTKESITGLFQIEAEDYEAAFEIAKTCPALTCNETVMIYQLGGG